MSKVFNVGIIGPGKIANRFASCFQYVPQAKVYAIASRDAGKAKEFAKTYGASKYYSSYEELLKDPAVDLVYIATPHPFHFEQTLLCLKHGKPVLCEKPLALNLKQVRQMTDMAKETNTFLMEGMWSRFFPAVHKTLDLIKSGVIGDIKALHADFGFSGIPNPEGRLYNMKLGGGAQLDVGVYPMFFALLVLGKPDEIKAFSQLASTGADTTTHALLKYKSGATAHILSSIVTDSPKDGHIMGTLGRIILNTPWHKSEKVTVRLNSGEITEYAFPHSGNGFEYQLQEVVRCLEAGKKECDQMPHSMSLLMAETSDEIRRQGGVRYAED
ncbi:MAG: Gfo/Idh/MocA family oxidoreductase [Cyclobacteriaceae bacterium]|nr:Gfo/Idh/MocA family oxidoreductase [Cyclobacteriaceae bacterium]